ncbi:phage holin family protein [Bacillus infantis]|nr:phage holin family protein [Bacillus infantis]
MKITDVLGAEKMMRIITEVFDFSNLLNTRTGMASVFSGITGSLMIGLYGETNVPWMLIVWILIGLDWIGGIAAAKKDGTYASEYGISGVMRTVVMIVLPVVGDKIDKVMGTPQLFFFLLAGGIAWHTWESMTANFARAGWSRWIPNWALNIVASEIQAKIRRSADRLQVNNQIPIPPSALPAEEETAVSTQEEN